MKAMQSLYSGSVRGVMNKTMYGLFMKSVGDKILGYLHKEQRKKCLQS